MLAVGSCFFDRREVVAIGEFHDEVFPVPGRLARARVVWKGLVAPGADGRARDHRTCIPILGARRRQDRECRQHGVSHLASIAIRDTCVADDLRGPKSPEAPCQNRHSPPADCSTTSRIAPTQSGLIIVLSQASVVGWQA